MQKGQDIVSKMSHNPFGFEKRTFGERVCNKYVRRLLIGIYKERFGSLYIALATIICCVFCS